MLDLILDQHNIVHLAAALYLCGFLFRDQIMLRALIIGGDIVYILYFLFAPEMPLWGGIFWSAVFIAVNAYMIVAIAADRTHFNLTDREKRLYEKLDALTPGEFRLLMRAGEWRTADRTIVLTHEGRSLDRLYFILKGDITLEKAERTMRIPPGVFIGEVAFLLGQPASATATVADGAEYIVWETPTLKRLFLRAPSLRFSLDAALNRDLAAKVAQS